MHSKDNPPPLPFAELLKRATPGPFFSDSSGNIRNNFGNKKGAVMAIVGDPNNGLTYTPVSRANAELIVRLISWAHAGGVEELRKVHSIVEDVLDGYGFPRHAETSKAIRTSLALLDGQKNL